MILTRIAGVAMLVWIVLMLTGWVPRSVLTVTGAAVVALVLWVALKRSPSD